MPTTDQQYDDEIELIVSAGMVAADDQMRDDMPQQALRLEEVSESIANKQDELEELAGKARRLRASLLPDAERKRLAQLVRDIREGNLPDFDADGPVTPCPDWCQSDRCANGEGKYHEGAVTTVEGVNWKTGMRVDNKNANVYVHAEEGRPTINIYADTDLDGTGAMDLANGLVQATLLWDRLIDEQAS